MNILLGKFGPLTRVVEMLSCLAMKQSIYITVNMGRVTIQDGKEKHFNTDVVFDRLGRIVAAYDKRNLFGSEKIVFDEAELEIVTFETEFGIFGIMTCFDAMYSHPFLDLVESKGIRS